MKKTTITKKAEPKAKTAKASTPPRPAAQAPRPAAQAPRPAAQAPRPAAPAPRPAAQAPRPAAQAPRPRPQAPRPSPRSDAFKTQVLPPQAMSSFSSETGCDLYTSTGQSAIKQKPTLEEIRNRIELEAYLLAERDGFRGNPSDYWAEAERQVSDSL